MIIVYDLRDAERKRKVKEIYGQLADQEGDYKAMKRNKDKMWFNIIMYLYILGNKTILLYPKQQVLFLF